MREIRYVDIPFPAEYVHPYAIRVGDEEIPIPEGVRLVKEWEGGRKFLEFEEMPFFEERIFFTDLHYFFIPMVIRAHCYPWSKTRL